MATYDHKQVLTDYANGKITPEMAVDHGLQHLDHLYAAQAAMRTEWRAELDALKQQLTAVQTIVDRLQAVIDGAQAKQKLRNASSPPRQHKPDFICIPRFIISGTGNFTKFSAKAGAVQGRHSTGLVIDARGRT